MSTLNARADQAWLEYASQNGLHPHSAERQVFEEGWETGYKTARAELAEEIAVLLEAQNDDDPCLRFDGYNHVDGCGAVGLECAAAIVREFGSAS